MCEAIYRRRGIVEFLALLRGKWDGLAVGRELGLPPHLETISFMPTFIRNGTWWGNF